MADKVYVNIDKCVKVEKECVMLKDVITVWCVDDKIKNRVNAIKIYDFKDKKDNRVIISALKIVEEIQKDVKGCDISLSGETDVLIELNNRKKTKLWFIYTKVAIISLIIFFGAGFTIMAFNNDVAVHDVFSQYYELVMGEEGNGFTILEVTYSIGLALGIIIFYNHFGAKRLSKDPTPIEVEMRLYENDINTTLIDGVKRKEEHIDVD